MSKNKSKETEGSVKPKPVFPATFETEKPDRNSYYRSEK